jgi:hypothetical protein
MRPPHTTDDIQSRSLGLEHASWRLPEVLGSPQRTSIRVGRDSSRSLFTAYARRRSGEAWKGPTYLTLGFQEEHQFILRRLHQVDASKTHESSGDINVLPWYLKRSQYSKQPITPQLPPPAASVAPVSRPRSLHRPAPDRSPETAIWPPAVSAPAPRCRSGAVDCSP